METPEGQKASLEAKALGLCVGWALATGPGGLETEPGGRERPGGGRAAEAIGPGSGRHFQGDVLGNGMEWPRIHSPLNLKL